MAIVASGQLLHLRLFLEGIEIPVVSASVGVQIGSPASAQVEIVATDLALELLPRTTVHLFYLDYEKAQYEGPPGVTALEFSEGVTSSADVDASDRSNDSLYHLLFCGELFSISYSKSGVGQRSVVLQCLDFSNVWDTHYLYNLRYSSQNPGDEQGSFTAGSQANFLATAAPFDDIINFPEMVAKAAEARGQAHNPALAGSTDIVGSLFSILELLGGVQGKHFGVNTWTTIEERRVRLMDQLAGDSGATAAKLYERAVFSSWLRDRLGGDGGVIGFRDLINTINRYIYYDIAPNPVGRYIPGSRDIPPWPVLDELTVRQSTVGESDSSTLTVNPLTGAASLPERARLNPYFLEKLTALEKALVERRQWNGSGKPRVKESSLMTWRDGSARAGMHGLGHAADLGIEGHGAGFDGRTLYPSGYDNKEVAKNTVYGRMHYHLKNGAVDSPLLPTDSAELALLAEFYRDLGTEARALGLTWGGAAGDSRWSIGTGVNKYGVQYTRALNPYDKTMEFHEYVWASFGFNWDPVHVQSPFSSTQIRADQARGIVTGVTSDEAVAPAQANGMSGTPLPPSVPLEDLGEPRERLLTQIFRPDVWFVPPPACNVLFPEEYVSLSFTRQMLREATRLQLTTFNSLYEDAILNQYYFAPTFDDIESLTVGGIGSASKSIIYPHEKFSGVVPKMERISEVSFYSKLSSNALDPLAQQIPKDSKEILAGIEDIANKGGEGGPVNLIENYAGRVAAFNFLTQRYAARSLSVTGKFLPRVVCGWPMLVVNRPKTGSLDPLHFLGMVVGLNHSLGQGGGNTSVSLTHARSHRTGNRTDDLFAKELMDEDGVLSIQKTPGVKVPTLIVVKDGMSKVDLGWIQLAQDLLSATEIAAGGTTGSAIREGSIQNSLDTDDPYSLINPPERVGPGGKGTLIEVIIAEEDRVPTAIILEAEVEGELARVFQFKQVTFVEQVGSQILPLEEAIRPPWFSDEYSNDNIGKLYEKFFGCPSLTDIRDIAPTEGETTVSIERAADSLVDDYTAHADGATANAYVYGTTRREFASLPDVMNSFHLHAYANAENDFGKGLAGLDMVGLKLTVQNGNFEEQQITDDMAQRLDPRADRAARVLNYLDELLISKGLRG